MIDVNADRIRRKDLIKLVKEVSRLERKLTREQNNRTRTEATKDKLQVLMKQIHLEIEESHAEIQKKNHELEILYADLEKEKKKSDDLLLNILPEEVADELKRSGVVAPQHFDSVSVLFTDFKGFTQASEHLAPSQIVAELDACFTAFDEIIERHGLEKLKTIGDSYMCAGGIPNEAPTHAVDTMLAALEIRDYMNRLKIQRIEEGLPYWELRIGIHVGPLVAGVIGRRKFAYDIWGDRVNTASRMESSGLPGMVNVSAALEQAVSPYFQTSLRGKIPAKNKGEIEMHFVHRLKPEYSSDPAGIHPNRKVVCYRLS